MKVKADSLGNAMFLNLMNNTDGDLSSTRYGEVDISVYDEAEMAISILRQLAEKKKRIVIDVQYPK